MKTVWILFTIGVSCLPSVQLASEQVVSAKVPGPFNPEHLFPSKYTSLNILKSEEIKNRHIVVLSVVGADLTAQTLILNIFLKFLHAQVNYNFIGHHWSPLVTIGHHWSPLVAIIMVHGRNCSYH